VIPLAVGACDADVMRDDPIDSWWGELPKLLEQEPLQEGVDPNGGRLILRQESSFNASRDECLVMLTEQVACKGFVGISTQREDEQTALKFGCGSSE
jgi:hypothetical protein